MVFEQRNDQAPVMVSMRINHTLYYNPPGRAQKAAGMEHLDAEERDHSPQQEYQRRRFDTLIVTNDKLWKTLKRRVSSTNSSSTTSTEADGQMDEVDEKDDRSYQVSFDGQGQTGPGVPQCPPSNSRIDVFDDEPRLSISLGKSGSHDSTESSPSARSAPKTGLLRKSIKRMQICMVYMEAFGMALAM